MKRDNPTRCNRRIARDHHAFGRAKAYGHRVKRDLPRLMWHQRNENLKTESGLRDSSVRKNPLCGEDF